MPGRKYNVGNYRFGFNDKENDNEIKGDGNQQNYGMRIYDPRLGKFLSIDPITSDYPSLTPYQFASNRTIDGIDQDGLEYARNAGDPATKTTEARDQSATYIITTPSPKIEPPVMVQDASGKVSVVPESQVQSVKQAAISKYNSAILDNIRNGGLITSVTYLITKKEELTFKTVAYDNIFLAAASGFIPNGPSSAFPKNGVPNKTPYAPTTSAAKGNTQPTNNTIAAKTGTYSDDLVKAAQKLYPNKAGKIELHHPFPKYMGGAEKQALVPLDAAYHQQITNEFSSIGQRNYQVNQEFLQLHNKHKR